MKFSKFFQLWSKAYYQNVARIGKKGDFFTAVSTGELFGFLLARHFLDLLDKNILSLPVEVVEIGSNEGYLSKDFLTYLTLERPEIFKHLSFYIIEPYEKLRLLQRQTLSEVEFKHIKSLEEAKFKNAFFFCNELFDSFSCELINQNKMAYVSDFKLIFKNINRNLKQKIKNINLEKGEFSNELEMFFDKLNKSSVKFVFAGFDYGLENVSDFSLRIYKKHEVFNFFEVSLVDFFQKSDLTYNVNFKHLKTLINAYDFKLLSFKKQKLALLDFGLEALLQAQNQERLLSQAKNLLFNFDEKFYFFEFMKS